ncbi:hypothetical protein L596_003645 [Steinernema carpocapsae]|uniref:non-specific serine/threonine protein kinase n=1 Tax=Steinernema carpocapsae TaxID=34508 RepID=A0A4U8UUV4_STECR|nr:hypothetical protein L596_003645 [Steinernema carpocapsae]
MDAIGDESLSPAGAASPQPTDELAELRSARSESPFPGYCFRHYQFGREVGRGNFATVFLARHMVAKVVVAIKVVDKSSLSDDNSRKLQSELRVLQAVHHTHIIKLYEIIETDRHVFLVTEFARNGELYDFLIRRGRLDEDDARLFFQQISSAIMYCHAKRIVHRDIKTENILLNRNNEVKLNGKIDLFYLDFGFSVFQQPNEKLSTWCGSPPYAAPELLIGKEYDGFKADVWSLGVVLYILVTGGFPFPGRSMTKLKKAIFNTPLRIPFWVSVECSDLIRRMLVVDPSKRISMSSVIQHKWFVTRMPNEIRFSLNKNMEPLMEADDPVPVRLNPSVLVFMQQYTHWSEEVIYEEVVKRNYYSPVYATYCILQDKLSRSLSRQNLLASNTGSPRRGSRGSILSGKVNIEPEPSISTIPTHHSAILMNPEYDSDESNVNELDREFLETSPPTHIPPCFGLTLNIDDPMLPNPNAYNFEVRRHTLCAGPLPVMPEAHQPLWNPLFIAPYQADRVAAVAAFNQQQQQQQRLNELAAISHLPVHRHSIMPFPSYERRASAGEAFFLPNGDMTQAQLAGHRLSYPAPPSSSHKLSVSPPGNIEEEGAQYLSRQGSSKRNTVHGTLGATLLGGPLASPINSARRSCHPYTKLTANERRSSWTSSTQLNNPLINSQQQAQLELLYRQALASPIQQLQKEFQQLTASSSNSNEGSRRSLCKTPPANVNCMPRISITDEHNRCYPTNSSSIDPVSVFRYQVGLLTGHSEANMGELPPEQSSFGPRPATVIGFTTATCDKQSPDTATASIMDFSPASNSCMKTVYFRLDVQSVFPIVKEALVELNVDFEEKSYNADSENRGVRVTSSDGTNFDIDLSNCLDSARSQMRVLFVSGEMAIYEAYYATLLGHMKTATIVL